jgi:hypothetical protein
MRRFNFVVNHVNFRKWIVQNAPTSADARRNRGKNFILPTITWIPGIQLFIMRLLLRTCALAVVLWYHPRLISKSSPVRFPAGSTKKPFLSTLLLSPHRLHVFRWRTAPSILSAKIRIAHKTQDIAAKITAQPAHMEKEDKSALQRATTTGARFTNC